MTNIRIKNGIIIPEQELEITSSRSGGPGGQHTNKTNTRITVRWNIHNTTALNEEQKKRVIDKLHSSLTSNGDLIIHSSSSRSQQQNKQLALVKLSTIVRNALHIPKKRMATKIPKSIQEARLQSKTRHSAIKQSRRKKIEYD
ncbi:MAG TPA: alternative ribosome rescue aminoacyl-tRNA hydrolase ArfB [Candidatus Babeliales bacterium]|jgi:ribosome-associated protein|nr:alternative ribosome rescue aminoacyl-tRNA hydrolase ArfB [Candidatus Babeliales bacterium]